MNKLLKILAFAIGYFVVMIIPVACVSVEEPDSEPDYDVTGKTYVNSYFNTANGAHEAGTIILEIQ